MPAIKHYDKYLGLPSFVGRQKKSMLQSNQGENLEQDARMERETIISIQEGSND